MNSWSKEELGQMLSDVVDALDLSDEMLRKHGPVGTPPAQIVKSVLNEKDMTIRMLKAGMININTNQ